MFPGMTEAQLDGSRRGRSGLLRPWPTSPANDAPHRLIDDVRFGEDVQSCMRSRTSTAARSATGRRIGTFVEIQRGARIGARCKIQSHTFICDGVTIEDEVFVGHGVMFVNDK